MSEIEGDSSVSTWDEDDTGWVSMETPCPLPEHVPGFCVIPREQFDRELEEECGPGILAQLQEWRKNKLKK